MKVCGIIAEYNPFHNGHAELINRIRADGADVIVAVMSGNFVQRGDAAICGKWARADAAVKCGVDLIIELPVEFAVSSAQKFAYGGVALLNAIGVNEICFGSESGNIETLKSAAESLDSDEVNLIIRELLEGGMTYAAARQQASGCDCLRQPNDTLGVEYIRAINKSGADIVPRAYKRVSSAHGGENSASDVRRKIESGEDISALVPPQSLKIIEAETANGYCPALLSRANDTILYKLRSMSRGDIAALPDISEGLENKIYSAIKSCVSIDEIAAEVKSKRYTLARIRRILLSALLGIERSAFDNAPQYIHVLAMNDKGAALLSNAKLPLILRAGDADGLSCDGRRQFEKECFADDVYALLTEKKRRCSLTKTIGIVKE